MPIEFFQNGDGLRIYSPKISGWLIFDPQTGKWEVRKGPPCQGNSRRVENADELCDFLNREAKKQA